MTNTSDNNCPSPACRATMTDGRIVLTSWHPGLMPPAPDAAPLRDAADRGVFIADVHVMRSAADGTTEITLAPLDPGAPVPAFVADVVCSWAASVGHRRVWLPDRILDVPYTVPGGPARVTCPTCGGRWSSGEETFFRAVREFGVFPPECLLCGGSLPQWTLDGAQIRLFGTEPAA